MSPRPYKPFCSATIGNTVSCHTLERLLNDIGNNLLNEKVTKNIMRYFTTVRKISLAIHDPDVRKIVGKMLLEQAKVAELGIEVPQVIGYVIRNIKYAYIKDMMISDTPMNYQRKLRPHEIMDWWIDEFDNE
jgi:hypothetical protein